VGRCLVFIRAARKRLRSYAGHSRLKYSIVAACLLAGCGGGGHHARPSHTSAASPSVPPRQHRAPAPRLRASVVGHLPAAVQLPAAARLADGRLLVMGGLNAADVSVAAIDAIERNRAHPLGRLPQAIHDATAVVLGSRAFVFGGGTGETGTDAIRSVDAGGAVALAGRLPAPASDVSAARIGSTAYVVGGYTGTVALRSIVAFRPGAPARVAANLPFPLRYAAVAAAAGKLVIAGGTSGVIPKRELLDFDPATKRVRRIGSLPAPLTHAAAAALGGAVYVIGGRTTLAGGQTRAILSVDPSTGAVRRAGQLPRGLSDAVAVTDGNRILVIGGRDADGRPTDEVVALER